jgi:signal peptidase I
LLGVGGTLLIALAIGACGTKNLLVAGDAMSPTLTAGQNVVANTSAYDSASPQRGDIILFKIG